MNKQETIDQLQAILDTNKDLSDEDKQALKEAIALVKLGLWLEAAKLIAKVLGIAKNFLFDDDEHR